MGGTIPGLVVLGSIRKQAEQDRGGALSWSKMSLEKLGRNSRCSYLVEPAVVDPHCGSLSCNLAV